MKISKYWMSDHKLQKLLTNSFLSFLVITTEETTTVAPRVHIIQTDDVRVMKDPDHAPTLHVSQIVSQHIKLRIKMQAVYIDMNNRGCERDICFCTY